MSGRASSNPPRKRKRLITACWECHRRKQKCNRARPCDICVSRNVPDQCSYGEASPQDTEIGQQENISSSSTNSAHDQGYEDESSTPSDLRNQTGYSSIDNSNVFSGMQKSLQGFDRNSATVAIHRSSLDAKIAEKLQRLVTQFPPKEILNELIAVYFSEVNSFSRILEPYFFKKLFHLWQESRGRPNSSAILTDFTTRDSLYFPALLFQVIAVAIQCIPPSSPCVEFFSFADVETCDRLSQRYSRVGLEIMNILGRHNSAITAVQHDLLRCTWLKGYSRGTESWYSLGNAIRQAQDLGLHLEAEIHQGPEDDLEETISRLWYDQYKRRVWAVLFIYDSHMALILGRPRTIHLEDCTVRAPLDCDIPDEPSKIIPMAATSSQLPSAYAVQAFHRVLALKMHAMMSLRSRSLHTQDYTKVKTLHDQVIFLLDTVAPVLRPENPDTSLDLQYPYLRKQRYHIGYLANCFIMALYRSYAAIHAPSREAAVQAALESLKYQQLLFETMYKHQYQLYGLSFYSIDAGIFLAATVIDFPPDNLYLLDRIYHALRQAIKRLSLTQYKSVMAKSGVEVLEHFYKKIQESSRCSTAELTHSESTEQGFANQQLGIMNESSVNTAIQDLQHPRDFPLSRVFDAGGVGFSQAQPQQNLFSDVFPTGSYFDGTELNIGPTSGFELQTSENAHIWEPLLRQQDPHSQEI